MPWRLGCPAVLHWHMWRGGVAREFGAVPGANLFLYPTPASPSNACTHLAQTFSYNRFSAWRPAYDNKFYHTAAACPLCFALLVTWCGKRFPILFVQHWPRISTHPLASSSSIHHIPPSPQMSNGCASPSIIVGGLDWLRRAAGRV